MAKVAAVAPVLAGLSGPAALAIGAGLTAGSALLNSYGQKQHAKRQDKANEAWLAYQNNQSDRFERADEAARENATALLEENLNQSDEESRREVIANEEERLAEQFGANLPATVDAIRGSGQEAGTSAVFDDAMARGIGKATADAKERMKALARATAYGSGSMGGMGMTDALRNQQTGNLLSGINQERVGDIGILQRYQQVQPEILEYEQSPLVPIMNAAGQFFLGGGAQNLGNMLMGSAAAAPGVTTGTGLTVNTPGLTPGTALASTPGMTTGTPLLLGNNLLPPSPSQSLFPMGFGGNSGYSPIAPGGFS